MPTVECDRAFLVDGQEISIEDATSGSNGYFCFGCGQELRARKGAINEQHFAHVATGGMPLRPCAFTSETYRHELAKRLLRQLKKVRVPAIYAVCPPDYHGRLPRLAEARDVEASTVLVERNVYINEQGDVCFEHHSGEPFNDHKGRRTLLGRPDVIFLDAQRRPILLIEIYATHKVSEEKLARLYAIGVDAVEISIPKHMDPDAIKGLFSVTSHTHWLYNGQQADYRFLATDSIVLADGSAAAAEYEGRLSGRRETLKCRRSRVSNALRGVRNCLGRADIEDVQRAAATAQTAGEKFTTGLESQRDKRDERLGKAERKRVAKHQQASATRERELAEEEKTVGAAEVKLADDIHADEDRLRRVIKYLESRIKRAEDAVEKECRGEMDKLRVERERRRAEFDELVRAETAVAATTKRLGPTRTELERAEGILTIASATNRRGLTRATTDLGTAEQATQIAIERKKELLRIESEAD